LPPVLQSGRIAKMFIVQGQEVKKGDSLYTFDTTVQEAALENAKIGVDQAKVAVEQAQNLLDQYPKKLAVQRQIVESANTQVGLTQKGYEVYDLNLRASLDERFKDNQKQWKELYDRDAKLYELDTLRKKAIDDRNAAQANLEV